LQTKFSTLKLLPCRSEAIWTTSAGLKNHSLIRRECIHQVGWTRPMQGWVKCNTNGDLIPQNQSAACGGVFRDESEAWRGGFVINIGTCSTLISELWGILSAL
jgi:hypothetical protein